MKYFKLLASFAAEKKLAFALYDKKSVLYKKSVLNKKKLSDKKKSVLRNFCNLRNCGSSVAFTFLFLNIAEVALRSKVFQICCALITLRFRNFFRFRAQFYRLNLILFWSRVAKKAVFALCCEISIAEVILPALLLGTKTPLHNCGIALRFN